MKSDVIDPNAGTATGDVSPTTLFAALSNDRRGCALQYLATRPGAVPLGDVAEFVTLAEGAPTRDRYERVLTGLYHTHVPHLVDAGLAAYDADRELVQLLVDGETIGPYLTLARGRSPE